MRKIIFGLAICSLFVLFLVTSVMADNGPHGGFTATTDACASCHRVHSAQFGGNALLTADPEALCESCHDGTGAATNVVDGIYVQAGSPVTPTVVQGTDGASLFGGGFKNALMATAWSGATAANPAFNAVSRPTTSMHDLGAAGTLWGSGANNTANGSLVLECTSCHDPHGNAGWNTAVVPAVKVASYRLLRWQPAGSGGFTPPGTPVNWSGGAFISNTGLVTGTFGWLVPDNFPTNNTEWYTIGKASAFAVGDYNAGNAGNVYGLKTPTDPVTKNYIPAAQNVSYFCAQCHDRYFNNSRLRNHQDVSAYCGSPLNGTTVVGTATLGYQPDADGVAPWLHPVDPVRCIAVVDASNNITGWGDDGSSGDTTYMFRHTSGDLRPSSDGTVTQDTRATIGRACVSCHTSHGTTAQMTALADGASLATGSTLLRMDNRSVCLRCHAGTVNFTVAP